MKRLSVRLSIVGTVLALGTATIAHSLLSQKPEEPANEGHQSAATATSPTSEPPNPIMVEADTSGGGSPALKPPPASVFERSETLRTVSHEAVSPANKHDGVDPTSPVTPISAADPSESGPGGGKSFPIADPTYATATESSQTAFGTPSGNFRPTSSVAPPPAEPGYAIGFPATDPDSPPADNTVNSEPETTSPPATSGFPAGETAVSATQPPQDPLPPQPSSALSGYPSAADAAAAEPVSGLPPNSGILGAPVAGGNPPDGAAGTSGFRGSTADAPHVRSALGVPEGASAFAATSSAALSSPSVGVPVSTPPYPSTSERASPSAPPNSGYGVGTGTLSANQSPGSTTFPAAHDMSSGAVESSGTASAPAGASSAVRSPGGPYAGPGGPAVLLASNLPGDPQLEGQQAPAIVLEKTAPEEIQVDRKATFQIRVRNTGNAPAHNVVLVDRVPRGTEFIDSVPAIIPTADGTLVWNLEAVKPGEEVVIALNVLPKAAGEIGSVAQATFQAQASVRVICTKPELKVDVSVSEEVLIGQPATMEITVTNTGNGAAEKVVLEEDVPEGFTHAAGRQLEHEIGTLRPQESRRLTLVLESTQPGTFENRLTVRGEGNLFDEDVRQIAVTSPQLQIAMQGPTLRYLDRQATYAVHLANPGTASARNVELVTYLPKGMKYVTSDNHGQYDSQSHAVYWSLEELPADKQGDVHVTVLPVEPGNQKLKTDARAELGLKEICEHEVAVEGLAEISFTVSDVADPIEVGSDTAYEIRVHNRGSKADTEIQLAVALPQGITPTTGDGPTQGTVDGQSVFFAPLARLGPNEEAVFKIHAQGAVTGDHVIRAQIQSTELRVPVTKEEITRVYSDK